MGRRMRGRRGAANNSEVCRSSSDVYCQTSEILDSWSGVVIGNEILNNLLESLKSAPKSRIGELGKIVIKDLENSEAAKNKVNDWFMKVLENLEERCEVVRSERDRIVEEYEENLMVCRTEVAESNKLLQDATKKLYASKAEIASLRRLVRNYLLGHESKLDLLQHEKSDLHQCLNNQKAIVTQISNDCASMILEIERLTDANGSLEADVLRLQTENKDLSGKIGLINAHISCESGSKHATDSDEVVEHVCALQAEKHVLECKNSSYEKTIKYLRRQLSQKTFCSDDSSAVFEGNITETLKSMEYYKNIVKEHDKKNRELQGLVDSSRNTISSLDAEVKRCSKLNQELLQNRNVLTKELNYCLNNLKQLNSSLEDTNQGYNVDRLTPILLALQFGFSCPMAQFLAVELKKLLSHLQKFMKSFFDMTEKLDSPMTENSCSARCFPSLSHIVSESANKTINAISSDSPKKDGSDQGSSNEVGRSSFCKFTVHKNGIFNDRNEKSCQVQ